MKSNYSILRYILWLLFIPMILLSSCKKEDPPEPPISCEEFDIEIEQADTSEGQKEYTVEIEEGQEPYSIIWSTGETTESIIADDNVAVSVSVTDNNGCVEEEEIDFVVLVSCDDFLTSMQVNQSNETQTLSIVVSGGTPPYSFQWSTGDTTQSVQVPTDNYYSVTTTDSNGCTSIDEI